MGFNKGHMEFTTLNLKEGFHDVPGYPPGFSERILAGSLDEKNKVGNRTRILRIEPGAYSTVPFVHEYWEEVFLAEGDLICGSDEKGQGGRQFLNRPRKVATYPAAIRQKTAHPRRDRNSGHICNEGRRFSNDRGIQSSLGCKEYLSYSLGLGSVQKMPALQAKLFSNGGFNGSIHNHRLL